MTAITFKLYVLSRPLNNCLCVSLYQKFYLVYAFLGCVQCSLVQLLKLLDQ